MRTLLEGRRGERGFQRFPFDFLKHPEACGHSLYENTQVYT